VRRWTTRALTNNTKRNSLRRTRFGRRPSLCPETRSRHVQKRRRQARICTAGGPVPAHLRSVSQRVVHSMLSVEGNRKPTGDRRFRITAEWALPRHRDVGWRPAMIVTAETGAFCKSALRGGMVIVPSIRSRHTMRQRPGFDAHNGSDQAVARLSRISLQLAFPN
jgi:hypothetical protein